MVPSKHLTKQPDGSWTQAPATRVQQARKKARNRLSQEIQLNQLQKKLTKLLEECPHEVVEETQILEQTVYTCVVCGQNIS